MSKLVINNYEDFAAMLGKNLGISEYIEQIGRASCRERV